MVERNKRRKNSEVAGDRVSASFDESVLSDVIDETAEADGIVAEETVDNQARRTSEAAGLAHWTAPPTGHVPKVIGDHNPSSQWDDPDSGGWASPDNPSWGSTDMSDAFSEPVPLTADATESTDGFGDRTRDPLADFAVTPGNTTRDPLADFVAAESDVSDGSLKAGASSDVEDDIDQELDLTVEAYPPDRPVGLDRTAKATLSPANLRPKHRSVSAEKRTVFDLPPSEQLGTSRAPIEPAEGDLTVASRPVDVDGRAEAGDPASERRFAEVLSVDKSDDGPEQTSHGQDDEWSRSTDEPLSEQTVSLGKHVGEVDSTVQVDTPPGAPGQDDPGQPIKAKGAGRNLVQATAVGVVLAAVVTVALWFGPAATAGLITVFGILAIMEFYDAMRHAGLRPASLLGMVGVASIQLGVYSQGADAYPLVLALTVVFGVLWYLVGADRERPVLNLGLTMMGLLWVGGLAGFGVLVVTQPDGAGLLMATVIITVASDTLAYIGGRSLGATPFHSVSPNKTWEGTIIGFAGALFFGLAIGLLDIFPIFDGSVSSTLMLAAVVGILAPMGDLAESMVKRDLGVKDMGSLLPGHGGVMDRLDGLLFALPGAYYVGLLFNLFG